MKRLQPISSSDSDSEENDLSKIKSQYKKSSKNEKSKKGSKRLKASDNQMSIETAFNKVNSTKRKGEQTLDNFIKKTAKVEKKQISAEDFFPNSNLSPKIDLNKASTSNTNTENSVKNEERNVAKSLKTPIKTVENVSGEKLNKIKENITNKVKKEEKNDAKSFKSPIKKVEIVSDEKSIKIKENIIKKVKKEEKNDAKSFKSPIKTVENVTEEISSPKSATKGKAAYYQYLHREAPQALGTKEIPSGSPNCLMGMTFVITGVLESIERDDAQSLIERHGGKVTKAVSGRTSFLVVGEQPGESKVEKAKKLKTKQINEDELLDLIRTSSSKFSKSEPIKSAPSKKIDIKNENVKKPPIKQQQSTRKNILSGDPIITTTSNKITATNSNQSQSCLFTEKYRPTSLTDIIGQQGDRSPAKKLLAWLKNFDANLQQNPTKSDTENGSEFKAALLSGPPGIGKTTTAVMVCKLLGYDVVELNASCVRSKNSIKNVLAESLLTSPFYNNKGLKHCVIMDEVDGMAGNEDRGGINELIQIIKTTKHPIICICNDRQSRKLQSFVKYVYDLRFRQLTIEQMKSAIMKIIAAEKLSLSEESVICMIKESNFDMRQVLNNLHMWSSPTFIDNNNNNGGDGGGAEENAKKEAKNACKEFQLGPFEVIQKVFNHEGVKTISEKSDLFFYDYQLSGLFVQENYPLVRPYLAKGNISKTLRLLSIAADSISMGDIINTKIRSCNNWGLLPTQAMFSSVIPGEYLYGRMSARIQFPSWLGKFSKSNKNSRTLTAICQHLNSASPSPIIHQKELSMDYGTVLLNTLLTPLLASDIDTVVKRLHSTRLTKEDMDLLIEMNNWSPSTATKIISSQLKSSLTRSYNKMSFKLPYGTNKSVKKSIKSSIKDFDLLDGEEEIEESDDNDDEDEMIVKKVLNKRRKSATNNNKKEQQEEQKREKKVESVTALSKKKNIKK